jgi:DNA-binding NarL/FixJ family response regulator
MTDRFIMPMPQTALIVDDEAHARMYARLLLNEVGIEICNEATNGEEALALFEQDPPDLVLLDMNLRSLTGLDVLERMKKLKPDIPIIILTSENATRTVYEAERRGALTYLLKHSSTDDALGTLQEALNTLA